jgi:hypothetical protein
MKYERQGIALILRSGQFVKYGAVWADLHFPFWAWFPHLFRNLLASGFSGNFNREIRRPFYFAQGRLRSEFLDRRLICSGRLKARTLCFSHRHPSTAVRAGA